MTNIKATIVIPTYKESANLKELITRIYKAVDDQTSGQLNKNNVETIVVDDNSQDGSEEIVNGLKSEYPNTYIIVRKTERGLSSAVLKGFDEAKGDLLLCMDADLQHPPEAVPKMLKKLETSEYVLGTRYGGGSMSVDKNWPFHRKLISKTARLMAQPLTALSDPMSGFFGIQKSAYLRARNKVNPIGFKIAMELYVKAGIKKHEEVPFAFGVRVHGESKLTGKVILNYLQHLYELYSYQYPYWKILLIVFLIALIYIFMKFIR